MPVNQEIALAFPRGTHQEMCITGILDYARDHGRDWSYVTAPESLDLSLLNLRGWRGSGVIGAINTAAEARMARGFRRPIVNISSTLAESPVPRVNVDNRRIGELAADHLMARNFHAFAYYGLRSVANSQLRLDGFTVVLSGEGLEAEVFLTEPTFGLRGVEWHKQHRALAEWLSGLTTPIALFAVTDYRAQQVIDVCRRLDLNVPEQIAVLGVDNEDFICRHVKPPLSSVARNNHQEGYRAAAALDRLMRGMSAATVELIPPAGVVERESTDVIAVSDERVRMALDYVKRRLDEALDVNMIARHVDVSRRWLEYAFRDAVGESPYQYIRNRRLEQVGRLLAEDRALKVAEIARRTGFTSAKQLTMSFQQWSGMSPREYRRSLKEEEA